MRSTRCSFQILIKRQSYQQVSKNPQIPNFMKIRRMRAELFHADGITDRHTD
jgi:hypothetical protein